jgi:hypothetical protein
MLSSRNITSAGIIFRRAAGRPGTVIARDRVRILKFRRIGLI